MIMRTPTQIVALALSFFAVVATSSSVSDTRNVEIFAWPLSSAKPSSLAKITYDRINATVDSSTTPQIPADEEIVRVGFYRSPGEWSGVATAASNFAEDRLKVLQLHVGEAGGEIYHVGFRASRDWRTAVSSAGQQGEKGGFAAELVQTRPGPTPHLNKPVVVSPDGQVEDGKEPEKTFLQKYWWAIGLFLILQLVMSGGKEEEKK